MTDSLRPERSPDLTCIFDPASIAVVGATANVNKWGYQLARGALRGSLRRTVYLVSAKNTTILGQEVHRSLSDLPEVPELVAIAVPLSAFDSVLDEALELGVRGFVAINAGFAEAGAEGRRRQEQMSARLRAAGAVMLGPNSFGVVDTHTDIHLAYDQSGPAGIPKGPVTVISQSGNVGLEVIFGLRSRGIGTARFVSVGNQADLDIGDFVEAATSHDETRVLVVYAEELRRARSLLALMHASVDAGKPVVLITPQGEAAARAAQSHTGAMVSNAAVVRAACRDSGVVLVDTLAEAIDCADVLVRQPRARGRRVGVVSDGGGHAVLACDTLGRAGFHIKSFSAGLQAALTQALDPSSYVGNPIDMASGNTRLEAFEDATVTVAESGEVDILVLTGGLGSFTAVEPTLEAAETLSTDRLVKCAQQAGLPMIAHTMFADSASAVIDSARHEGASVFADLAAGVRALDRVLTARTGPIRRAEPLPSATADGPATMGYFGARQALAKLGVEFARAESVATIEEALAAAEHIGYPVVLKAVDLLHKSDMGGVKLGIADREELATAYTEMRTMTGSQEYSIEQMLDEADSVELIVGARRDDVFGPIVMIGLGGIFAELLHDTVVTLAPASADHVEALIGTLDAARILVGARGRPPVDVAAAARAAVAAADLLMSDQRITDVEVNPLRAYPSGAIALDARTLFRA